MGKAISVVVLLLFIAGVIYGAFFFLRVSSPEGQAAAVYEPYILPTLSQDYKNTDFNFELQMPEDFKAVETPSDENGTRSIVLQNTKGEGIQILVTPFAEEVTNLTEERIHQDVPDLKITDAQPIDIGDNDQGLAFKSDNEAFDGASREVWFVFRGNLYQISTYDRLDPLLKAMFGTWKFL